MKLLAFIIGVVICLIGTFGMVNPDFFYAAARLLQASPFLYIAAVLRVGVGVTFFLASTGSRAPTLLMALGVLLFIGGVLTPFIGAWAAAAILDWWTQTGPLVVQVFGGAAFAVGLFVVYAVAPIGQMDANRPSRRS